MAILAKKENQFRIIRVVALILFLVFIYFVQDIIYPIIISLVLFYILNPIVCLLSNPRPKGLGINRIISIFISFVLFILIVFLFFRFIIPPFANEFSHLTENLPSYLNGAQGMLDNVQSWYAGFQMPDRLKDIISSSLTSFIDFMVAFVQQTATGLMNVFSQFLKMIVIPVITYYLLKDKEKLYSGAMTFIPKNHRHKTEQILEQINAVLNNYIKGELILCAVVGLMVGIGLYFLGVKFYLIFGLISAITEFIPVIGPFLGAVPAVIIAFLISPVLALKVIALYILIQAFENSLLVPRILGDKLNLHPVTVIIAILILGKLIGGWGLFFAAPIMAIIKITYLELSN